MISDKDGYDPEVLDQLEALGFTVERTVAEKRKRGRPRLPLAEVGIEEGEGDDADRVMTRHGRDITRRQGRNAFYAARASHVLPTWEWTDLVLTELGRLGSEEAIRAASERLWAECLAGRCSDRAQDRVALLRSWRLGPAPAQVERLQLALERTIEQYGRQHAGMTDDLVNAALTRCFWQRRRKTEMSSE